MVRVIQRVEVAALTLASVFVVSLVLLTQPVHAITQIPTPPPQPGSFGVEATKTQPAPTVAATISTPGSGASFTNSPITVSGICPAGLLVQVYDNGVMAGSAMCTSGSFSMQVSLFAGTNELSVLDYDDLEQPGPAGNTVTVTYTDTHFTAFGALVTLTSSYGRRSAPAGSELTWPLQLSGGTGPYAFSLDWGDGSKAELKSQSLAGIVNISHVYEKAGIYQLNVTVTDSNGVSAFLQLVAVASGRVDASTTGAGSGNTSGSNKATAPKVLWAPAAISFVLLLPTFWLGRMSQVVSLRNKMLKEREEL